MFFGICGAILIGLSLGLFGSGGSIITLPVLIYLFDYDPKSAIAASLGVVAIIALFGALRAWRCKKIELRVAVSVALPGMVGAWLGAYLAQYIDVTWQLLGFVIMVIIAAIRMFNAEDKVENSIRPSQWLVYIIGLMMGVVTGIVGVGGGFVVVPVLVLFIGLPMGTAVGTSLAIVFVNSATGYIGHLLHDSHAGGSPDIGIIVLVAAFGIVGSYLGGKLAGKISQTYMRRGFSVFLLLMAGAVAANIVTS